MAQRLIEDDNGLFTCEVEVQTVVLQEAMEHEEAEDVLKCALIAALTALAEAGPWPDALLESMATFMLEMREAVIQETLS
jgi:hypothetical protein